MKVKIKSVLKTTHHEVESFDDQQIMTRSGNTLCIKEIGKNQCRFICLHSNLKHLFAFKPATNRKGVFTAQRIDKGVQIAHYNLRGDRKSISLSDESTFFTDVESIQLLVDECDNSIVYGGAKNKEGACIFLGDINKGKLLATGFMASYQDIKVQAMENLTLSVCYNNGSTNYLRHLKYALGQWEVTEQAYKKIQNGLAFQHLILPLNRIIFVTKNCFYHFEDVELIQTIQMQKGEKIRQIMRIDKGLLVFGELNTVQVFVEDSDEVTLLSKGLLKLQLQSQDQICKVLLSLNNQQVIVRTVKNNIYVWKCQLIDLDPNHSDFTFVKAESSCASSHQGSISISTGKKYCLLSGTRNVTLWGLQKNQFVLSSQFISNFQAQKKKTILSCAINPDGNSFMIAFEDRIKVYKILLTKFKFYAQFPIKKCSSIVYSHGGQLVACKYGKGINSCIAIINNLRLVEVGTLKIQAEPTQIVWNELDDQIIIPTDMNSIQVYTIADSTRTLSLRFDSPVKYARIDYKMRKIMVSSQNKVSIVSNGEIVQQYTPPFSDFHYIFPLYETYFITTLNGMLHWSSSYKFQHYSSYSLFIQSPFNLVCRNSYLLAYSSFEEVMVLECMRIGIHPKKGANDDIVMVEKDEIIQFYEKIKMLQASFDMLQSSTQIKLQEEKNNYDAALKRFKKEFSEEICALSKNFNEMAHTKIKQEKETELTFEAVQAGQLKNVQQIQTMYQRKCAIIQQKLLNLQQNALEQKNMYESLLADLQTKYHKEVSTIRNNYEKKIKEETLKADEAKKNILDDKKKMEFKLFQLEEQNQYTLQSIQQNKDTKIAKLTQQISYLETQLEQVQIKNQTTIAQFQRLQQQSVDSRNDYQLLDIKHQESLNRIKILQKQIESKNQMIEEKNQIITELNHQVGGLQKAKYVLSFRTAEIRKQLEPKEALADRLKSELNKLDQQFKQTKKKNFELSQRIDKINKINDTLKKENAEMRMALKLKDRIHSELCFEIFNIINTIDPKQWNEHFIKIYKAFIKEQKFRSNQNRKKDDTSQQLNRHLMHVQLSLQQVATSNDKILRGKEKDITRRMEQNSKLLYEINVMKQKEKEMSKIHNELAVDNDRLQKELDESYKTTRRNSTRAQTSNTGLTRRGVVSRDALYSRQKSMLIDRVDSSKEKDLRQMLKERSRVGSAHKTLMYRDDKREKSAKFFDMARQLQSAKNTIKVQEQMLQQLNQRLFGIEENQIS